MQGCQRYSVCGVVTAAVGREIDWNSRGILYKILSWRIGVVRIWSSFLVVEMGCCPVQNNLTILTCLGDRVEMVE